MSKIQSAVEWAVGIASDSSHGYAQDNRWGPDYDCSSLVISAWEHAGVPVKTKGATYTGNMKSVFLSCGFKDVTAQVNRSTGAGLQTGDVLLNEQHHTAMYIGGGNLVQASINEKGGIRNGQTGDQTGREIASGAYYNFPWDCVLRFSEEKTESGERLHIVQQGEGFWAIAASELNDAGRWRELAKYNGLSETHVLHPGDVLRIPVEQSQEPQESDSENTCSVMLPYLMPLAESYAVRSMQTLLSMRGYKLPDWGVDGEWGDETSTALAEFKEDNGITEDGCGPETWAALIGE